MKQINAYETSDGTLFSDKDMAERHEEMLKHSETIERFLDSDLSLNIATNSQRIYTKTMLTNWEIWKRKNAK